MNNNEVMNSVIDALLDVGPEIDLQALDPVVSFRDQLETDSVDFLHFFLALEKKLDTKIPAMDFHSLSSLNGCVEHLTKRVTT